MTDTTGFAPVPWDMFGANGGEHDGLPPDTPDHNTWCCESTWPSPADTPDGYFWTCTLPWDHVGTHRAGNGRSTIAEWGVAQ